MWRRVATSSTCPPNDTSIESKGRRTRMTDDRKPTRRGLLLGGGAAAIGAAIGAGGLAATQHGDRPRGAEPAAATPRIIDFYGTHQAGIADATPTHSAFLAFDLSSVATRVNLASVLRDWTRLGEKLSRGDTEADESLVSMGSEPGLFTMTVGIGGSGLDKLGFDRPRPLVDLPEFAGDRLDPEASHGDLFVQLCSNDAIYLSGAVRAVRAAAASVLDSRWQMNGFRGINAATSSTSGRNLMGQIDGTNNIAVSRASVGGAVWADEGGPSWMRGGTYVAVRRFRMLLAKWEGETQESRDRTIGRHARSGAPLGSKAENDPVDLEARDSSGDLVIPSDSHVRLATPRRDSGEAMLRRSYSYSAGQTGTRPGDEDAGLIFVSYQADPTTSFIPVQQRLAASDALNRFTVATSSALFAILPGVQHSGDWYGKALLG